MYYVYIITNESNSTLYIGFTNDIIRRITEHKLKIIKGFSSRYNLNKLVYFEQTTDVVSAISREKQLKTFSREKKDNLIKSINPKWCDLYDDLL